MNAPIGVLLVNLGTPDAPDPAAVRRYLAEFLADPRVLDIHPIARWLLLNLIILPRRPAASAHAYQKIWTAEGSPLLVHGRALRERLAALRPSWTVELAMRYGNPSIRTGMDALVEAGCDRIVVVPLYPQYASSTTGSTLEAVHAAVAERWNTPFVTVVPPFYDDPRFIAAMAEVAQPPLRELEPDHVVMSFHGVPERHVHKSDPSGSHCLRVEGCCDAIGPHNRNCYRAQCYATARALAEQLGLPPDRWTLAFQSRLGRDPWIRPYTAEVLPELATRGIGKVAVLCPAFVADCLETLEEIGMQAKADYEARGGTLRLIPSLNATPAWVEALAAIVDDTLGGASPIEPRQSQLPRLAFDR